MVKRSDRAMILMTKKHLQTVGRAIGFLVLLYMPNWGNAQALPEMRSPPSIHMFGTYSFGSSDFGVNHSSGYSIGGYAQTVHLWGGEMRGSYLYWGHQERRYDAVFGPRVALHYGRFAPYGEVLVGVGHGITWVQNNPRSFRNGTGLEWKVVGGTDFYAGHHVSFRLGEVSFSRLSVLKGISSLDFSGGVVYRFPLERWERR